MSPVDTPSARRARRRVRERELGALPERPTVAGAFVPDRPVGAYDQIEVIRAAVAGAGVPDPRARDDAARFLVHLLTTAALDSDGSVPVPSKLIERRFRRLDWRALEEAGVVDVGPYDRVRRRCREFRPADDVRRAFYEAGPTARRVVQDGLYDVSTGRPTTRRTKSQRRTPSGNALPPLVRAAIDAVGEVPVDVHAIERHLGRLRVRSDEAEPGPARATAEGRYLNDLRCHHAVLTQGARPLDPTEPGGLWAYRPAYRPQRFGRVSQIGGGLQSCSTAMKGVAYPDVHPVDGTPIGNLDLRASQASLLVVLLEEAGVDPAWLRAYVSDPDAKRAAAAYVGVPVATWKECLYALLMGALVATLRQVRWSRGRVAQAIRGAAPPGEFAATYARFLDYTEGLRAVLARWHRWLVGVYVPENARPNNADGKRYVTNECGAKVAVEDLAEGGKPWRLKARLAASLLQGREAALVHTLAASSREHGFRVLSHEHDGLVVAGRVPAEAVEAAAAAARVPLDLVALEAKPFA